LAAEKLGQVYPKLTGEAIMDKLHGRHPSADDPLLIGKVKSLCATGILRGDITEVSGIAI
jgi:hypothetical protein